MRPTLFARILLVLTMFSLLTSSTIMTLLAVASGIYGSSLWAVIVFGISALMLDLLTLSLIIGPFLPRRWTNKFFALLEKS